MSHIPAGAATATATEMVRSNTNTVFYRPNGFAANNQEGCKQMREISRKHILAVPRIARFAVVAVSTPKHGNKLCTSIFPAAILRPPFPQQL